MKKVSRLKEEMFENQMAFYKYSFPDEEPEFVETISPGYDTYKITEIDHHAPGGERSIITYLLLTDSPLSVDLQVIGAIEFRASNKISIADVQSSELNEAFRGRGLGRMLYKAAVNDLLKDYRCVRSDSNRSRAAEGVWQSFCRANPEISPNYQKYPYRYEATKPLRRRPVKVRHHHRKIHLTKNWARERQFSPDECQPKTFRVKRSGKHLLVLCRKKGSKKTSLQSLLHPREEKRRGR